MFDNVMEAQIGMRDLTNNPHRVELAGTPASLTWPDICPNCGDAARDRLSVGKVFLRQYGVNYDQPDYYWVTWAAIPFCPACIERHRSETKPVSPVERLVSGFLDQMALPMLLAGATALFLAKEAIGALPDVRAAAFMGGLAVIFGLVALVSARTARKNSARFRVPRLTTVTSACDFSDDVSEVFDAEHRVYAIRNAAFAKALAAANHDRVWDAASPAARKGRSRRRAAAVLLFLVAGAWLAWTLFAR